MARAILRTSINGPHPNNQQQQLRTRLERVGFVRVGTGAYEGDFPSKREALAALRVALDFLDGMHPDWDIDHLWVYVDEDDPI